MTWKPYSEADVERLLQEAALRDRHPMDDATTARFLSLIRQEADTCTRNRAYKRVASWVAAAAVLGVATALLLWQPEPDLPVTQEPATVVRACGGAIGEEETISEPPTLLSGESHPDKPPGAVKDALMEKLRKIFPELLRPR